MPEILKNYNKFEIKKAIELNWREFFKSWATLNIKNLEYEENDMFFKFMSGVPYFRLNGVIDAEIPPELAKETIKEIITSFKERKLPFVWIMGPSSNLINLREQLLNNGLIFIIKPPGMAFNLKNLTEEKKEIPGLEIIKVKDFKTMETYVNVGLTGLEWEIDTTWDFLKEVATIFYLKDDPKHSAFIAYYKGKPVAISKAFYGAGVVGMYRVTTLEEARHKGIGTAISLAPLYEAKERDYEIATLISTDMGFNIYKRIGFDVYCEFEIFGWSPYSNEIFSVLIH